MYSCSNQMKQPVVFLDIAHTRLYPFLSFMHFCAPLPLFSILQQLSIVSYSSMHNTTFLFRCFHNCLYCFDSTKQFSVLLVQFKQCLVTCCHSSNNSRYCMTILLFNLCAYLLFFLVHTVATSPMLFIVAVFQKLETYCSVFTLLPFAALQLPGVPALCTL